MEISRKYEYAISKKSIASSDTEGGSKICYARETKPIRVLPGLAPLGRPDDL